MQNERDASENKSPLSETSWWQQHAPATASLFSSIPKPWKTLIQDYLLSPIQHKRLEGGKDPALWTNGETAKNTSDEDSSMSTAISPNMKNPREETLILAPLPEWARQVRDTPEALPWRPGSWSAFLL